MKKINDIKNNNLTHAVNVAPDVQDLIEQLIKINTELNTNSYALKEYDIAIKPIFSNNEVKDIDFSLNVKNFNSSDEPITLFSFSTTQSFYRHSEGDEYQLPSNDPVKNSYFDYTTNFRGGFYHTSESFKEVVESFIIEAFLSYEKTTLAEKSFNLMVEREKEHKKFQPKV